jgi:predicted nucleic acid-binding protein
MPFYFLDTSGAVKIYHHELGSDKVKRLYVSSDDGILISNLAYTETLSALNRKKQNGAISQDHFDTAINQFIFDYLNKYFVVDFNDNIRIQAGQLIIRQNLRSADSIQLATALESKELNLVFVCADEKLCNAAIREGLQVFNPEK